MSKRPADILFQLIHSLEKAEKRHFKLYIKRSSSKGDLKIVQLFDAIDKLPEYDEKALLKKLPRFTKEQLSSLKSHLYKQILASLRLLKSADSIDLQLNEQFDYAHILYKKGLFLQSLRIIEKAKDTAKANQKINVLAQFLALEKRIESLHITRSIGNKAEVLSAESVEVSTHIDAVTRLSNLALILYSWYIKHGHVRNKDDEASIKNFMRDHLPHDAWQQTGFYERLYLYQSFAWYAFIRQDFLMYYRYAQKWVNLFDEQPSMKRVETGHFIKGVHNLMGAHFTLRDHKKFSETLSRFEQFAKTTRVQENDNFRVQCFLYITQGKINQHFMKGSFSQGLSLVPDIQRKLSEYILLIDQHRVMVMHYKIAALYFGAGDYSTSIDYLQKIINETADLRYDLQCYARLLHLLAHYELGNLELMEYLGQSVYNFMRKMKNLTYVEEEMLKFLRRSSYMSSQRTNVELKKFVERISSFEKDRFQTRVFVYMDIISWGKAKLSGKRFSEVLQEKYKTDKRKKHVAA